MKIGVFLAYMPGVKLGSEGLGRYIGNLIKGFLDDNNRICLACPKWLIPSVYDLFDDFHIRKEQVEIVTTHRVPALWVIYNAMSLGKGKGESRLKHRMLRGYTDFVDYVISLMVSFGSIAALVLFLALIVILALVLLPLFLLLGILGILALLARSLLKKTKPSFRSIFEKLSALYRQYSRAGTGVEDYAYKRLYSTTVSKIIKKLEQTETDLWFIPTLFWPEAADIKGLTVFAAPDMVTTEFPYPFAASPGSVTATDTCAETIRRGSYFISYCDFIKRDVLMKRFGKKDDHIISISHINNSSLEYVNILEESGFSGLGPALNEKFCRQLLFRLPAYSAQAVFLKDFDFENVQFIFYASQQRPHKNILNLLKAYNHLKKTKDIRFKLFLTCELEGTPSLANYICENHLEHDIFAFKRVPVQLLSALYCCARLVVNPTLYEGAFLTFPIGEGMSVGTPSIMGRIPQVTDVIPGTYPLEHILFDPHDYMDLADKILYGFENAEQLYEDELPMYRDVAGRTGPVVSADYIRAFKRFAEIFESEKKEDERSHE